jgi:hypothetical protein
MTELILMAVTQKGSKNDTLPEQMKLHCKLKLNELSFNLFSFQLLVPKY